MIIAVIVLAVLLAAALGTLIPVVAYQHRRLAGGAGQGAAPELEQALARERRRADIAEAELKVVRNRISSLESQLELPESS